VSLTAVAARLKGSFAGRVELEMPLSALTTYRLGGPAELYVEPAGVGDLRALGRALAAEGYRPGDVPVIALGRGSNLVVSDEGLAGVVVRLGPKSSWVRAGAEPGVIEAGASTPLPQLANWAARRGLTGLEWLVSIPGSVGGAVRMNAGAHGGEVASVLSGASIFDLDDLTTSQRTSRDLGLAYRSSDLGDRAVVVSACFRLRHDDEANVRARMEECRRQRAETQPGAAQNAGSVFKNPPGDSAGRLVESAGFKGYRIGGAEVSRRHANFFVASDDARAQDVFDLVAAVRAGVRARFGVDLEPEIRFVGPFEPGGEVDRAAGPARRRARRCRAAG
jgi:UDP-N-acetylmuramate dehydrogenase